MLGAMMANNSNCTKKKDIHLVYGPKKGGNILLQRLIDNESTFSVPAETKLKFFSELTINLNQDRSSFKELNFDNYRIFFPVRHIHELGIDQCLYHQKVIDGLKQIKSPRDYVLLHISATTQACRNPVNTRTIFIKDVGRDTRDIFEKVSNAFKSGKIISIRRDPKWVAPLSPH